MSVGIETRMIVDVGDEEDRRRREEDDRRRREDEERRRRDDTIDKDRRRDGYRGGDSYSRGDRADQYPRSPRGQYPRSPRYGGNVEGYRNPSNFNSGDRKEPRSRWESDRDRRDGYRSGYERTGRDDLKRAIDEGLVVLDDHKYVEWADNLDDVSMFPSMKENVEARRVVPNKGKGVARTQSVRLSRSSDEESPMTPIRVAVTKSARASSSKKADTDYVMEEKDGQRIEGGEIILSPRKRGARKFTMKSTLDDMDTVEPLRRALGQPMQCTILEYLAASRPARDELQMITRKARIPLSDEVQMTTKQEEIPTVAVSSVVAKADRAATMFLDGIEGVPPDKFYILGSGTIQTTLNDEIVLHAVIDNATRLLSSMRAWLSDWD
ncbi:hypothetical protein CBR_g17810 [Chara braunii]|uniref:Uncharacterized protein n=1 Tax=Chara braunii TaxID=69332 RepID=A0A388KVL4_CHABU|nr:hypothetical protein CBR_g17810 [Chara braunii]|eukprot:GBG74099.1 hypothetical protein CBR_g17810 [Chara braunii]